MTFFSKTLSAMLASVVASVALMSCNSMFHDNLDDCPQGVYVKFYHQTECEDTVSYLGNVADLHVFAFDEQGRLAAVRNEKNVTLDSAYSVLMPVSNGNFTFLAWTGIEGEKFNIPNYQVGVTTKDSIALQLKSQAGVFENLKGKRLYQGDNAESISLEDPATVGSLFKNTAINLLEKTYRARVTVKLDESLRGKKVNAADFALTVEGGNGAMTIDGATPLGQPIVAYPATDVAVGDSMQYTLEYNLLDVLLSGRNNTLTLTDNTGNTIRMPNLVEGGRLNAMNVDLLAALLQMSKVKNVNLNCLHDVDIEITVADECEACKTYYCTSIRIQDWLVHSYSHSLGNR